jgi:hypothetical protein
MEVGDFVEDPRMAYDGTEDESELGEGEVVKGGEIREATKMESV